MPTTNITLTETEYGNQFRSLLHQVCTYIIKMVHRQPLLAESN